MAVHKWLSSKYSNVLLWLIPLIAGRLPPLKVRDFRLDLAIPSPPSPIPYLSLVIRPLTSVLCHPSTTVEEITALSPFFKGRIPDRVIQRTFEGNMIKKILDLLLRDGAVKESEERFLRV